MLIFWVFLFLDLPSCEYTHISTDLFSPNIILLSKLLFSLNTIQPEYGRHVAMFIVCSACHHPPQACSRSDRNSTWPEGPGEGEDSGAWVAPRVGLRMLGDKNPKRTAGGASGTQTPACSSICTGQPGCLPSAGSPAVTQGHSTTLFMLPAPPGCHEGKTQAKLSPGEVGGARHTGIRDPGSGLGSVTDLRVTLDKSHSSAFLLHSLHNLFCMPSQEQAGCWGLKVTKIQGGRAKLESRGFRCEGLRLLQLRGCLKNKNTKLGI